MTPKFRTPKKSSVDFQKIASEADPEQHKEFMEEMDHLETTSAIISELGSLDRRSQRPGNEDLKLALSRIHLGNTGQHLDRYFMTYNYLIGMARKLVDDFQQEPFEIAAAYALAAGWVIGASSQENGAVDLFTESVLSVAVAMSHVSVDASGMTTRASVFATGETIKKLVDEFMEEYGRPIDINQCELADEVKKHRVGFGNLKGQG